MKQLLKSVVLMVVMAECSALYARTWTYPGTKNDNQTRTVTNDEDGWALTCTSPKNSGGKINITAIATIPEGGGVLDLTGDFVDSQGSQLALNSIVGGFGDPAKEGRELITGLILPESGPTEIAGFYNCSNLASISCFPDTLQKIGAQNDYLQKNSNWGTFQGCAALKVIPMLPAGLTTIYGYAFANCTAAETILGDFLPDSVTTLGAGAFLNVPAARGVVLNGVSLVDSKTFRGSGVTSVHFGKNLKRITSYSGSYPYKDGGAFADCPNLVSVTFDSENSEVEFFSTGSNASGRNNCTFANCPKLSEELDFSALTNAIGSSHFENTPVKKLKLGDKFENLPKDFFKGMTELETVVFAGDPPTAIDTPVFNGFKNQRVVTFIDEAFKDAWAPYSNKGEVDGATSFWGTEYVGENNSFFPLRLDVPEKKWDELGQWIYNPSSGTITDGTWIFEATADGKTLTVGTCTKWPDSPSTLDFSGHVSDANKVAYWIIALDMHFGATSGQSYKDTYGWSDPTDAGLAVSELILPADDSLITIGVRAFGACKNLVTIRPMLPDTISSIGMGAFWNVPAAGDLYLMGVDNKLYPGTFYQCQNLTSVTFGLNFPGMDSRLYGTFAGCTSLTNLVFDAEMHGAEFGQAAGGEGFKDCTGLSGSLDLSGFTKLGTSNVGNPARSYFANTHYDTVFVAADIDIICQNFFEGMSDLKTVRFLGKPPAGLGQDGWHVYDALSQTITTEISKKNLEQWAPYMEGGVINGSRAYFDSKYLADGITADQRPVKVFDITGLVILFR